MLKFTQMTAVSAQDIYKLIQSEEQEPEYIISKYRLYVTAWKYRYYDTANKYIPGNDKLTSFNNFIALGKYEENFPISDSQSDYILGGVSLVDLKNKVDAIINQIKKSQ